MVRCLGLIQYVWDNQLISLKHVWVHATHAFICIVVDLLIVPKSAPILLQFCSKFAPIYTQKNKTQFNTINTHRRW